MLLRMELRVSRLCCRRRIPVITKGICRRSVCRNSLLSLFGRRRRRLERLLAARLIRLYICRSLRRRSRMNSGRSGNKENQSEYSYCPCRKNMPNTEKSSTIVKTGCFLKIGRRSGHVARNTLSARRLKLQSTPRPRRIPKKCTGYSFNSPPYGNYNTVYST